MWRNEFALGHMQFRRQRLPSQRFNFGVNGYCLTVSVSALAASTSALQFQRQRLSRLRFSFGANGHCFSASFLASESFASALRSRR
jgi:hypothetical protein